MNLKQTVWFIALFSGQALLGAENRPAKVQGAKEKKISTQQKEEAKIEFQGSTIQGIRRDPFSSYIDGAADNAYSFIKIRQNWDQEMINSAGSLDSKGKKSGIAY